MIKLHLTKLQVSQVIHHYNSESCIIHCVWSVVLNLGEEAFSASSVLRIAILRNIIHKVLPSLKYKVNSLAVHHKTKKIPEKFCQTQKGLVIYLTMEFRCLGVCFGQKLYSLKNNSAPQKNLFQ